MTLFTIKYAPKNSKQVFGQDTAVAALKSFLQNYKEQKSKAALLHGPLGVGKTSSVYALAQELKYDLLEINSSDLRNAESITSFLGAALGQQSLFFTPKLVLIDEVDNISGVKDRGCIPALLKAIEKSKFPVVLTANDIEDKKLKPLKKLAKEIEYVKLDYKDVAHGLEWVAQQENIHYDYKAINSLARQVDGDLRAGLLDLQSCGKEFTFQKVTTLSDRKRMEAITNSLRIIFKSSTVDNALSALDDVDVDMDHIFFWMDANLPREYKDIHSLARAYEVLSRADVFRGRIKRRQHWRFLAYMNNLLTAGISAAKEEKNPNFVEYKQTMRLLRIWQANMKFAKKKEIAKKLAEKTHVSTRVAMQYVPHLQNYCNGDIAAELDLSDDEVGWLGR